MTAHIPLHDGDGTNGAIIRRRLVSDEKLFLINSNRANKYAKKRRQFDCVTRRGAS
jgi:hypothetical protein